MDLRSGISIRKRKKVYTASDVRQQEPVTRLPAHVKTNDEIKPVPKTGFIFRGQLAETNGE